MAWQAEKLELIRSLPEPLVLEAKSLTSAASASRSMSYLSYLNHGTRLAWLNAIRCQSTNKKNTQTLFEQELLAIANSGNASEKRVHNMFSPMFSLDLYVWLNGGSANRCQTLFQPGLQNQSSLSQREVNISAYLSLKKGLFSYWALCHQGQASCSLKRHSSIRGKLPVASKTFSQVGDLKRIKMPCSNRSGGTYVWDAGSTKNACAQVIRIWPASPGRPRIRLHYGQLGHLVYIYIYTYRTSKRHDWHNEHAAYRFSMLQQNLTDLCSMLHKWPASLLLLSLVAQLWLAEYKFAPGAKISKLHSTCYEVLLGHHGSS